MNSKSLEQKKSIFQEKPNVSFLGKVIVTNKCIHIIRGKYEQSRLTIQTPRTHD